MQLRLLHVRPFHLQRQQGAMMQGRYLHCHFEQGQRQIAQTLRNSSCG
jgi:hypothetical protein